MAPPTRAIPPTHSLLVGLSISPYSDWNALNAQAIGRFVSDFGLDGVDIDFEPANPNCRITGNTVACDSDNTFISVIDQIRSVIPQGGCHCTYLASPSFTHILVQAKSWSLLRLGALVPMAKASSSMHHLLVPAPVSVSPKETNTFFYFPLEMPRFAGECAESSLGQA